MNFLSPLGDLEMDLSGDIPSQSQSIRHLGLIVPNIFKPFNDDQTRPGIAKNSHVQPSTTWYSQVQPGTAKYSIVQPRTAWYSQEQPSTAKYSQVQPNTAKYSLV